ncbi:alanine racemase [Paenibacillus sp. SC116]|uniref:alanine racemase n=1 Tax=Paenibacillus sp. SC116 TaxID=2968986 RepID=UPI00215A90B4|nr:alanine racemase [Paenibacillus sp. SC116]MCR8844085.1 alanine racemase [Paenibacillus sp. SC116]
MESYYRPTRIELSLDALEHNIQASRSIIPKETKLGLCVKANAYGHGAVEIARAAEQIGVDYFNVAFIDEAIQLRQAGIMTPILVLGYTPPEAIPTAFCHHISINVYSEHVLEALEQQAPTLSADNNGHRLRVHVKIDSGMGRLGLRSSDEAVAFMSRLSGIEGVEVEGLFTHFASADETDKSYTNMQVERFQTVVEALKRHQLCPPVIHLSNSAGTIELPECAVNMVRVGISMYGLYPSEEVNKTAVSLQPVMSWKSQVVHVKQLPAGEGVSYGTKYFTTEDEWIATIPVGYADGYSRLLSGKAEMLIRGKRVPVIGRICMDQCMVSLAPLGDEAAEIRVGEEVVLIGTQHDACISTEEVAEKLGTINYEIICMLAHRIPRIYVKKYGTSKVYNPLL